MNLSIRDRMNYYDVASCIARFIEQNPSEHQRYEAAREFGLWFLENFPNESLISNWAKLFQEIIPTLPFMLTIGQEHPANKDFQRAHNHKLARKGLSSLIRHSDEQARLFALFLQNPERISNEPFALATWNLAVLIEHLDLKSKINWYQMILLLLRLSFEPSNKSFNWLPDQSINESKTLRKMVILYRNFTTHEERQSLLQADQTGILKQIPQPEPQRPCPCHVPYKILRNTKNVFGSEFAFGSGFATQTPFQPLPPCLPSPVEVARFWWLKYQENPSEKAYQMLVVMDWKSNFDRFSSPSYKVLMKLLEKWPTTVSNWWKEGNRCIRLRQFVEKYEPNQNNMRLSALYYQEKLDKLKQ